MKVRQICFDVLKLPFTAEPSTDFSASLRIFLFAYSSAFIYEGTLIKEIGKRKIGIQRRLRMRVTDFSLN